MVDGVSEVISNDSSSAGSVEYVVVGNVVSGSCLNVRCDFQ